MCSKTAIMQIFGKFYYTHQHYPTHPHSHPQKQNTKWMKMIEINKNWREWNLILYSEQTCKYADIYANAAVVLSLLCFLYAVQLFVLPQGSINVWIFISILELKISLNIESFLLFFFCECTFMFVNVFCKNFHIFFKFETYILQLILGRKITFVLGINE